MQYVALGVIDACMCHRAKRTYLEWQSSAQKVLIASFELDAGYSDAALQFI